MSARLMIVEDEIVVAEDLSRAVRACGYDVVGCTASGHEAVEMARNVMPDLVLMDVVLEGEPNGIAAAQRIAEVADAPIVFITGHSNDSLIDAAVRAGADGYVVKPFLLLQVTTAIRVALTRHRGRQRIAEVDGSADEPETRGSSAMRLRRIRALAAGDSGELATTLDITPREQEIVNGLMCYRRLSTVARVLGISIHTARNHLKSVFGKLGVHSQEELLLYVMDGGPAPALRRSIDRWRHQ